MRKPWKWVLGAIVLVAAGGAGYWLLQPRGIPVDRLGPANGDHIHVLVADPQKPHTLLMGDQNRFLLSQNGRVWQPAGSPANNYMVTSVAFGRYGGRPELYALGTASGDGSTLVVSPMALFIGIIGSSDNGATWHTLSRTLPSNQEIQIAASPRHPGLLYTLIWRQGLYRSTNNGATWQMVASTTTFNDQSILAMAEWPDARRGLLVGTAPTLATEPGLFVSSGGRRFIPVPAFRGRIVMAILPTSRHIWVATADGLYRGNRNASGWRRIANLPNLMAIDHLGHRWAAVTAQGVYLSTDNGNHWTLDAAGLPTGPNITAASVIIAPWNPNRLYVGYSFPVRVYRADSWGGSFRKL